MFNIDLHVFIIMGIADISIVFPFASVKSAKQSWNHRKPPEKIERYMTRNYHYFSRMLLLHVLGVFFCCYPPVH